MAIPPAADRSITKVISRHRVQRGTTHGKRYACHIVARTYETVGYAKVAIA